MFPQAPPKPKAAETRPPADVRRTASPPSPTPSTPTPDRQPATAAPRPATGDQKAPADPGLPLRDRHADVDLPVAEMSQAEEDRYWDVEVAPAIVPQAKEQPAGSGQDAVGSSRYLDYVREDQPAPPAPDLPIAPPIVARPTVPAATVISEPKRSVGVPVLLALAVGLMLGFGAGYGVGLRQGTPPAADSSSTDATPPPAGREFTERPVPDAPTPAATAGEPPAPTSGTDAGETPPSPSSPPPSAAPTVAPPAAAAAAATRPPEPDGRLLVRTTPAGARVFVDGRDYGLTPFAVRNLAPGGHRVRVVREGYTAQERRVVLTASQPSQSLTIDLERQGGTAQVRGAQAARTAATGSSGRFTGDLSVASNPPGATVFMDGKQVGTTPLMLRAVPAGSHAIRLEHDGYRRWSSAVRVVASQPNRITASLER